jgi:hypothetical protein
MNGKIFTIIFLMSVLFIFGLGSCFINKGPDEICNAKNNLDWEGFYTGTILMPGSGHVANVRIRLDRDQTFEYNREYMDKSYDSFPLNFIAPFWWDDTGNIIMIDAMDVPVHYKVEKDMLIRLNADSYVLKKVR